jgi:small conductance mechanosensitive channel
VKDAIQEIQHRNSLILQGPVSDSPVVAAPWIGLSKLGESGVEVNTRSWCKGSDYWAVYFYLNETVYQELKEKGFMFPFNRMDVNILSPQKEKA